MLNSLLPARGLQFVALPANVCESLTVRLWQLCRSPLLCEGQLGQAVLARVCVYVYSCTSFMYILLIKKYIPDASSLH